PRRAAAPGWSRRTSPTCPGIPGRHVRGPPRIPPRAPAVARPTGPRGHAARRWIPRLAEVPDIGYARRCVPPVTGARDGSRPPPAACAGSGAARRSTAPREGAGRVAADFQGDAEARAGEAGEQRRGESPTGERDVRGPGGDASGVQRG